MDSPFIDLGYYKWSKRRASVMGKELTAITSNLGFVPLDEDDIKRNDNAIWSDYDLHAEVRWSAKPGSEGTSWHRDGDTSGVDMDFGMILWCASEPTEIMKNDIVYQPEPFHIVYFNNIEVVHRRPPHVKGRRWSFRQRVERAM